MAIYKLNELYTISSGLNKGTEYFGKGNPFLSFKDIFYNTSTPHQYNEFVEVTEKEIERFSVRYGDVFLTRTSETINELGMSCICINEIEGVVFNGFSKRLRPNQICKEKCLPEYMQYAFRTDEFRRLISSFSNLSTRASLNEGIINKLFLNIPSLKQQQEIIDIIKPIEDAINNLDKQIEEVKKILVKQYESLDNIRVGFSEYIELCSDKYSGQESYLATNAVGEFIVDILKEQNITEKRPSRANLTPVKNSIIISKLDGENKILYIDEKFNYVVSTGFFNFTSEYLDYVVGFLLSEDFKKQKTLLSTGTTMVGLNNVGLNKVLLTKPIDKDDKVVKFLNILIKNKLKLKEELDRLVLLLIK